MFGDLDFRDRIAESFLADEQGNRMFSSGGGMGEMFGADA